MSCKLTNGDLARIDGSGCSRRIVAPFTEDYGIKRVDFGAIGGLGLEARLPSGTIIGLEGRYELGLTNIRRATTGSGSHNSTFFILLNVDPK